MGRTAEKIAVLLLLVAGVFGAGGAHATDKAQAQAPEGEKGQGFRSFGRGRAPFDAMRAVDGHAVVVGRGGLVAVLQEGTGALTRTIELPATTNLMAIAAGSDGLLRATDGEGVIWRFSAALDEVRVETETGEGSLFGLQYLTDGSGIAVGEFGTVLIQAPGTSEWRRKEFDWPELLPDLAARVGIDLAPHLYRACARPGGGVVVAGEYGVALTLDGDDWQVQQVAPDVGNLFACLAGADGLDVVAGQSGKLFYRTAFDAPWQAADSPVAFDVYDLAREDGAFLAVGQGAAVLGSTDAVRWAVSGSAALPSTDWIVRALPTGAGVLLFGREGYLVADSFRRLSGTNAGRRDTRFAARLDRGITP